MCYKLMDTMEPHGRGTAAETPEQRIKRAELALSRTEEMIAENNALCSRIRTQRRVVEAKERLMKVDPNSPASNM
ncbi:hypothetical protein [Mesorhizobium sp.]|uniref:hypothetical protein n=1 Tax=Mesorhizobium sp. TaxID=1871066 RepID=UPI00257FE8E5|nr:hypothetical protein [Mesorhizobium sp.]